MIYYPRGEHLKIKVKEALKAFLFSPSVEAALAFPVRRAPPRLPGRHDASSSGEGGGTCLPEWPAGSPGPQSQLCRCLTGSARAPQGELSQSPDAFCSSLTDTF